MAQRDGERDTNVAVVGASPRPLSSVLGEEIVAETIGSFVDYLENAIAVYERDGTLVGEIQAGNDYCRLLVSAAGGNGSGGTTTADCRRAGSKAALAAMRSGAPAESLCPGGFLLYAVPVFSEEKIIIGACVAAVSETPGDPEILEAAAARYGVRPRDLERAAAASFHKPAYLYEAGRSHVERLAKTLARLYGAAREKEAVISRQLTSVAAIAGLYDRLRRSEARYREIYDGAADWIYTLSDEGTILGCNRAMAEALGHDRGDIVGRRIYEFVYRADRERDRAAIEETSQQGASVFQAERRFVARGGKVFTMEIHARSVRDGSDARARWQVVARDVTEKKEAQRQLNLMATAIDNSRDGVVISDLDGDIVFINRAGASLLGGSVGEILGRHFGSFWSSGNPAGLKEAILRETMEGGWEGQLAYRRLDGEEIAVHASSALVTGDDGKPAAMVGMFHDISEEQRMTREILRRNRELAVINAVSTTSARSFDLETILQEGIESVVRTMNYDAGVIYLKEEGSDRLTCRAHYGIPEESLVSLADSDHAYAGAVTCRDEPVFIEDAGGEWFESVAGVPVVAKGRYLGVLSLFTFGPHRFDRLEQSLLVTVAGTIGVAVDNARLFADVARAKNEWETTFDAMTNGVSIHDRDFNIVRANRALAEMLGTTTEELVGRKCYQVFHGRSEPIPGCPHRKACSSGRNASLVWYEQRLEKTLDITADPLFDGDGRVSGTVHDTRDITEEERLREQLSRSERIRSLGEMAGGVAHDFNNYLTVILGNAQWLLSQEPGDGERADSLRTIERAATDAAETVRRIQEFTRVRTVRSFHTVDINEVVSDAVEVTRPRWRDQAEARGA